MIRFAALSAFVVAVAVTPLAAQDPRLVEVPYDEARVFVIEGKPKVQATIRFGEDETIENVAIGDSQSWQVTPNKRANLLFVKPLAARAKTNMTVVTNKRTYLFDLVAGPSSEPIYVLSFTYPDEPGEAQAQLAVQTTPIEQEAAHDALAVIDPADLNFAWEASGDAKLLPVRIFDDGEATFLVWPEGRPMPAILTTNSEGDEGPVNFTVRDGTVVVLSVPREIVLRAGEDRAVIVNNGPVRPQREASAQGALASAEVK